MDVDQIGEVLCAMVYKDTCYGFGRMVIVVCECVHCVLECCFVLANPLLVYSCLYVSDMLVCYIYMLWFWCFYVLFCRVS